MSLSTKKKNKKIIPGLYYNKAFLNGPHTEELIKEVESFYPIWEERFSKSNPPPEGDTWRSLKRPVYWLGNWQFACHGYYHPPKQVDFRCVRAEAFPPFMQRMVNEIENLTRRLAPKEDVPAKWHLNTCLINYYGSILNSEGKWEDQAQVGDHRDAEPGPVASVSLGERAWFQYVKGKALDPSNIVLEQWLDHQSLLVFWGKRLKDELFHRVQRVEDKGKFKFNDHLENYHTRRINLTFRYVPVEHILDFAKFPDEKKEDVKDYVAKIGEHSDFFKKLI
jgi:DNA oxidative demethylase